jgi:hypothetical protein
MANFNARPHFENRQQVQWPGESIDLSGQTTQVQGIYNTYFYNSYEDFLNGISGGTGYVNLISTSGNPSNEFSGYTNQPTLQPGIFRIKPPQGIFYSGNTNIVSGYTSPVDTTNFVLTSLDSMGTAVWSPLSAITSMSGACTPDFYVGTIHPCSSGGTVTIEGNLLVRGETISATTIIETETLLVEDNNIDLNYGGSHTTSIGGGITVLSGISNTQDSIIATDNDGVFVFNPGISTPTIDITNLMSGETISLLAITSGGTVVDGTSMYGEICESCDGSFLTSGTTIGTGTTVNDFTDNLEPVGVDCVSPKCCTQWTVTYRVNRIKQELITTNYEAVLKYKEAYNAHVRCSDSNNTGVNHGGKYWTADVTGESIPTYDTKPLSLSGVVYEDMTSTSTTVNEIEKSYKVQLENTSYTKVSQSDFISVSESTMVTVDNSINDVIDSSVMVETLTSTDGYIDGSNRVLMLGSHDSTIKDAKTSSIISSISSVISGVTNTVVIGGQNITGTTDDTVYVPNLNIGTVGGGASINNLGIDVDGNVVTGTAGGGVSEATSAVTTTVSFSGQTIYYDANSPTSGTTIGEDLTGAKLGVIQKIYSNAATEPTYGAGWVLMGDGIYFTSILNIIYAEWAGGSRVEYWYVQEQ